MPEKELRAIRFIGLAVVAVTAASAAVLLFWSGSPFALAKLSRDGSFVPLYLIGPAVVLYVATGIGLIYRTRWGYVLLKCLLYILYLAFPVGTVVSYMALSYLRRHGIKRYFGFTGRDTALVELAEGRWFKIVTVALACALAAVFAWMMFAF